MISNTKVEIVCPSPTRSSTNVLKESKLQHEAAEVYTFKAKFLKGRKTAVPVNSPYISMGISSNNEKTNIHRHESFEMNEMSNHQYETTPKPSTKSGPYKLGVTRSELDSQNLWIESLATQMSVSTIKHIGSVLEVPGSKFYLGNKCSLNTLLKTRMPTTLVLSPEEFRNYQKKETSLPRRSALSQKRYPAKEYTASLNKLGDSLKTESLLLGKSKKVTFSANVAIATYKAK